MILDNNLIQAVMDQVSKKGLSVDETVNSHVAEALYVPNKLPNNPNLNLDEHLKQQIDDKWSIVLCGSAGCGKSSLLRRIRNAAEEANYRVVPDASALTESDLESLSKSDDQFVIAANIGILHSMYSKDTECSGRLSLAFSAIQLMQRAQAGPIAKEVLAELEDRRVLVLDVEAINKPENAVDILDNKYIKYIVRNRWSDIVPEFPDEAGLPAAIGRLKEYARLALRSNPQISFRQIQDWVLCSLQPVQEMKNLCWSARFFYTPDDPVSRILKTKLRPEGLPALIDTGSGAHPNYIDYLNAKFKDAFSSTWNLHGDFVLEDELDSGEAAKPADRIGALFALINQFFSSNPKVADSQMYPWFSYEMLITPKKGRPSEAISLHAPSGPNNFSIVTSDAIWPSKVPGHRKYLRHKVEDANNPADLELTPDLYRVLKQGRELTYGNRSQNSCLVRLHQWFSLVSNNYNDGASDNVHYTGPTKDGGVIRKTKFSIPSETQGLKSSVREGKPTTLTAAFSKKDYKNMDPAHVLFSLAQSLTVSALSRAGIEEYTEIDVSHLITPANRTPQIQSLFDGGNLTDRDQSRLLLGAIVDRDGSVFDNHQSPLPIHPTLNLGKPDQTARGIGNLLLSLDATKALTDAWIEFWKDTLTNPTDPITSHLKVIHNAVPPCFQAPSSANSQRPIPSDAPGALAHLLLSLPRKNGSHYRTLTVFGLAATLWAALHYMNNPVKPADNSDPKFALWLDPGTPGSPEDRDYAELGHVVWRSQKTRVYESGGGGAVTYFEAGGHLASRSGFSPVRGGNPKPRLTAEDNCLAVLVGLGSEEEDIPFAKFAENLWSRMKICVTHSELSKACDTIPELKKTLEALRKDWKRVSISAEDRLRKRLVAAGLAIAYSDGETYVRGPSV